MHFMNGLNCDLFIPSVLFFVALNYVSCYLKCVHCIHNALHNVIIELPQILSNAHASVGRSS